MKAQIPRIVAVWCLVLVGCQQAESDQVAPIQIQDISSDPSGAAPPPNVVAPEVDAESARSIEELLSSTDPADHAMSEGDWSSTSFSEPIAFRLNQPGRVAFQARGFLVIDVGPVDDPVGFLQVIEAVAFSTPDGPAPLGSAALGREFPNAAVVDRGLITSQERLLSWVDLRVESAATPESFQFDCVADDFRCTELLLTETTSPRVPLDLTHRYVGQDFGSRRLYVSGVAYDELNAQGFADLATEVALSIIPAEDDWPGRKRFTTLDQRGEPIPAGTWFAEVAGSIAELRSDTDLEEVTFDWWDERVMVFTTTKPDSRAGFFVFDFRGFVESADMRTPSRDAPLSADEFIDGLSRITELTNIADSSIAGQDAITWEFAPLDPESPLACVPVDRDDLGPDDLCVSWGPDGLRHVQFATEPVVQGNHYVPELGIIVAWSYTDTGEGNPFAGITEALSLNKLD